VGAAGILQAALLWEGGVMNWKLELDALVESTMAFARVHLMNRNHIRHLPVIDNYSLIGVISISDISTAFGDEAAATQSVPA